MSAVSTTVAVLLEALAPVAGRRLLDVGCGSGALARALLGAGARVTGIDPSAEAVAAARAAAPGAVFEIADAADLPFATASFDGAVFLNSLHHIAAASMRRALREAARVTGSGRPIVVVEPLAEGSFFEVVRALEDETQVRREAAAAILDLVEAGTFAIASDRTYERLERLRSPDQLLDRLVAADPARAALIPAARAAVAESFARLGEPDGAGGSTFRQPMRAVCLRVTA